MACNLYADVEDYAVYDLSMRWLCNREQIDRNSNWKMPEEGCGSEFEFEIPNGLMLPADLLLQKGVIVTDHEFNDQSEGNSSPKRSFKASNPSKWKQILILTTPRCLQRSSSVSQTQCPKSRAPANWNKIYPASDLYENRNLCPRMESPKQNLKRVYVTQLIHVGTWVPKKLKA